MTNEERVLNTIHKQSIDYLPNQIYFTSYHTKEKLRNVMHFQTLSELDRYLDNHLSMTSIMDDVFRYHQNPEALAKAEKMGFARCDRENGTVYDRWGIGYDLYSDGYCIKHFPLTDEESIRRFTPPDPLTPGNLSQALDDLQKHSGETLVACTGYIGILEKAWGLMGFEEFMLNITLNPELIAGLLDKIVEYKMEIARQVVKTGFRCGHTGDDFGTQRGLLLSQEMWREFFKPRWAKVWKIYKDAGLPVIHHTCGNITDIIGDMIDIGLNILEPVQPVMDLKYLKKEFGKDITFFGGIDTQEFLPYGTPREVKLLARETIETLGQGGGMIIYPSQEIMNDVPIENIVALVDTILEERERVIKLEFC